MNATNSIGKQNVAEGILKNAVDSISLGIEDYQLGIGDCESSDPRRLVSCTRNLFAGIILLFKHKLAKLSPPGSDEVLIKQRILQSEILKVTSNGRAKEKRLLMCKESKNDLQVFIYTSIGNAFGQLIITVTTSNTTTAPSRTILLEVLSPDCFIVIRDFVREYLKWIRWIYFILILVYGMY